MKKVFLAIFGIVLAYFIFLAIKTNQFYQKIYTPKSNHQNQEKNTYNILLFGYGGGQHEGAYLTDTMMLFHLDLASKSAVLVSIPRDLWVKIPTKDKSPFYTKINAVYQTELFPQNYPQINPKYLGEKKDAHLAKFIIGGIFGLKIDNYVAIDFEGFKKAIDILGGVDVEVEKSFTDPQYPIEGKEKDLCDQETEKMFKEVEPFLNSGYNPDDKEKLLKSNQELDEFLKNATESPHLAFPCRYEVLTFNKGKTHMDGEMALKFVRSRHALGDGSDFARAKRQQLLLEAVKDKVLSLGFLTKIIPLLDQLGEHLKTDLTLSEIEKLSQAGLKANQYQLKTYVLSTDDLLDEAVSTDGQYILIPKAGQDNWQKIQEMIENIITGKNSPLTPTATPKLTEP